MEAIGLLEQKLPKLAMSVEIRDKPEDVIKFLPFIRAGADTAKEELGFLPRDAYNDFAVSGKLLVAIEVICGKETYAGHIMFGGVYPNAKIFQLFITTSNRGRGIAGLLVDHLKRYLTKKQWLSIRANVADDLAANSVWAHMGFRLARTKPGGSARKRQINVRVLELETPSLLRLMSCASGQKGLRLAERLTQRPIYLIDLNVLFDVVRSRPRSSSAGKVILAGLRNSIRLMVAAEFTEELLRTSIDTANDPILAFAKQLDCLSKPPNHVVDSIISELAPVIFPGRTARKSLSERDRSDLVHIATAIHHGAAGFITSENAILRARNFLCENYNIDVSGVEEFARIVEVGPRTPRASATDIGGVNFNSSRNNENDLVLAGSFLKSMGAELAFGCEALACQGNQAQWVLVKDKELPLGYAKWEVHGGLRRAADIYLVVDEEHYAAETIIDHLLDTTSREASNGTATLLRLHIPRGQVTTRQAAISSGYQPPEGALDNSFDLQRVAIGRVVSSENWNDVRQSLISVAALSLPTVMPPLAATSSIWSINTGQKSFEIPLAEMEQILSPALFVLPNRAGVIVPIQEQYARELLACSPQFSMLASPEASMRKERVYISAPNTYQRMVPGNLMLFYESLDGKGRGCVIALARICTSRVVSKVEAIGKVKQSGVLDDRTLAQRSRTSKVTETSFDNIFLLRSPVKLKRLRELGCVDGSNFVTVKPILFDKLMQVLSEGHPSV